MNAGAPAAGRHRRRRLHPIAWFGPVAGSLVALAGWAAVAHSSGSGWVQALGAMVGAVLVTGMLAPVLAAARAGVACVANPSDAEAGQPVGVTLVASGPLRLRPRSPGGPVARAGGGASGGRPVAVEILPERRGVIDRVVIEAATSAPFGLLWWGRDLVVPLAHPMSVAPRRGEPGPAGVGPSVREAAGASPVPGGLGDPRGVRPYAAGDPRRSVHWPVTAHVGALMVRETERPVEDPVFIDVVLPADDRAEAEAICERAMGTGSAWLDRGRTVILHTEEKGGPVSGPVRDRIELGRRLARARPPSGGPASPPGVGGR